MRVVAGKYRGRRLAVPRGQDVRPTSERSREALFNILESGCLTGEIRLFPGGRVLDAFAGSGALGIEAFSRGASDVIFIEQSAAALAFLRQNLTGLEPATAVRVLQANALKPPVASDPVDLLLMDPPYEQALAAPALSALASAGWVGAETMSVVETSTRELQELPPGFRLVDRRRYGRAQISFLRFEATGQPY